MENNEAGLRYTDHLYHSSLLSDEEVSDDECLLRIGEDKEGLFCDGGEKGLDQTSEIGNDKCYMMDMEMLEGTNVGECVDLNGKDYSNLNMDDMKDVVFSSVCEAEKFYHLYSRVIGFSTRRDRKVRAYRSEFVIRREWVCSKQGKATIKVKKQGVKEKGNSLIQAEKKKMKRNQCPRGKRYSRVGCMAAFGIRYCKERKKYFVSKFVTNHNHDVAVSEEVQFLRSHRGVNDSVISQVEGLQKAQVHISRIYELLVEQAGGQQFLPFTLKDLYNELDKRKKAVGLDGDAHSAITWMQIRALEEKQFYCKYTVDKEGRLANLFWRDRQSLLDYNAYGDVLIMDSTYKTNIYGKPLVVFVGCNNHRATVVYGFSLIGDEKEETYSWVFQNFLAAMNQKHPISVLTDGDEAIRNVVENLMPTARHRLCAWHIGRNIGQNVKVEEVQESIGKLIYASLTVQEWEAAWHTLVQTHGLANNAWVTSLYNKRERWAEAYFRNHFFGGMCSTQRCEGMHVKLKKQIGRYTRICDVMPRLERTLGRIRNRVLQDNFLGKTCSPVLETHMRGLEEEAAKIFTHDIFVMIKSQILFERRFVVRHSFSFPHSDSIMFYLTQYERTERRWCVEFRVNEGNPQWLCSCKQFECDGIPCGHIFCVLKYEMVSTYPKSLIRHRWSRAVAESTMAPNLPGKFSDKAAQVERYSALIVEATKVCVNYSFSREGFGIGMMKFQKLKKASMQYNRGEKQRNTNVGKSPNVVRDPPIARTKGSQKQRPSNTNQTIPGPKGCGLCAQPGHNRRTCPTLEGEEQNCSGNPVMKLIKRNRTEAQTVPKKKFNEADLTCQLAPIFPFNDSQAYTNPLCPSLSFDLNEVACADIDASMSIRSFLN